MQILHRGIFMPAFDRILQLARMEEMDCEFVEVTAHEGARPTHAVWQGRFYHRGGAVVHPRSASAIGLVLLVQIGLGMLAASGTIPTIWCMALLMFLFFCGFNALEATQPSLVSRMAPAPLRGAALGAYNTLQSLGLFAGGAIGGAVAKWAGVPGLFVMTAVLTLLWLVISLPLRPVGRHG